MKSFHFILVLLLSIAVQANGIKFQNISFDEAKTKAKKENKLIFTDAFATWCGPCKKLDHAVFSDKAVGDFFNKNFICIKIDVDKPENRKFVDEYNVSAMPTLLFIHPSGKTEYKSVGYLESDELLVKADYALNPGKRPETKYATEKKQGKLKLNTFYNYILSLENEEEREKIVSEYLTTITSDKLIQSDSLSILLLFSDVTLNNKHFKFILQNKSKCKSHMDETYFMKLVYKTLNNEIKKMPEESEISLKQKEQWLFSVRPLLSSGQYEDIQIELSGL